MCPKLQANLMLTVFEGKELILILSPRSNENNFKMIGPGNIYFKVPGH